MHRKAARLLTHRRPSMRVLDLSATRLRLPKLFDTGHEELPGRWLPLFARAIAGDRRGHVPAHALPSAESPKVKKTPNHRKPKRHAAHDRVRTEEALGARRALIKMRQWLVRVNPQIPEVADMLVIRESVWQRGARAARSPAFGVAAVEYLICALVVVGAAHPPPADGSTPPPADGSTAHIVGINPRTAPTAVSGSTSVSGRASSSRRAEEPDGDAPKVHIDPQSFAALEKALSELDKQAHHDQLKYRKQGVHEAPPPAGQAEAPASVPEASAIAPPPAVASPNEQTADSRP